MKKQPTKTKSTVAKARTTKTTVTKARTSRAKTVVTKKKTTQRKGLLHHTKRIYHLTPKFVHGALIGAFVGMLLVTWIGSTGDAHANPPANTCIKTNGPINVNLKNANVEVKTNDCGKHRTFVMKAWYAPSSTGEPHDQQRLFARSEVVEVKKNSNQWTKINVKMLPEGCFYQVDLVDITDGEEGGKNPIVRAVTGGSRDCTPKPEYSCNSMTAKAGAGRSVAIDSFDVTAVNATLSKVVVYWGDDANAPMTYNGSPVGVTHQYAADGTYNIQAAAYFTVQEKNGTGTKEVVASKACTAQVSFAPVTPGNQQVCELKTGKIVQIPEGSYDTSVYGPTDAKECNPTITVTSTGSETPTLTNTGPGAILVILAFALVGGYTFHRTHHHITRHVKKHVQRRHAH